MGLFIDFHEHGSFVRSLNSTFVVLILKRGGTEDLKDFIPISLIGSIYKLIAKVSANRLRKVMNKLVNSAQNAFVEGRQILDASLIANEVIDSMLKKKEKGVLYKLDIEKAYMTRLIEIFSHQCFLKWALRRSGWVGSSGVFTLLLFQSW